MSHNYSIKISGEKLKGKKGSDIVKALNVKLGITGDEALEPFKAVSSTDERTTFAFIKFGSYEACDYAMFKISDGLELFPGAIITASLRGGQMASSHSLKPDEVDTSSSSTKRSIRMSVSEETVDETLTLPPEQLRMCQILLRNPIIIGVVCERSGCEISFLRADGGEVNLMDPSAGTAGDTRAATKRTVSAGAAGAGSARGFAGAVPDSPETTAVQVILRANNLDSLLLGRVLLTVVLDFGSRGLNDTNLILDVAGRTAGAFPAQIQRVTEAALAAIPEDHAAQTASWPDVSILNIIHDNDTYLVYHGTSRVAAEAIQREGFRPSTHGTLGPGVYVSRDLTKAQAYLKGGKSPTNSAILVCTVNVGRVCKIERPGDPLQAQWQHEGFDSAWVPPGCGVGSGQTEQCIRDPARITVLRISDPWSI